MLPWGLPSIRRRGGNRLIRRRRRRCRLLFRIRIVFVAAAIVRSSRLEVRRRAHPHPSDCCMCVRAYEIGSVAPFRCRLSSSLRRRDVSCLGARSSDFGLRPPARSLKAWAMKIITAPWNLRVCRASMPLRSCANYTYYSNWYWSQMHRLPSYRVVYNLGLPISRGRERGSARVALPPTPSQQLFRHFVVLLQIRGSESERGSIFLGHLRKRRPLSARPVSTKCQGKDGGVTKRDIACHKHDNLATFIITSPLFHGSGRAEHIPCLTLHPFHFKVRRPHRLRRAAIEHRISGNKFSTPTDTHGRVSLFFSPPEECVGNWKEVQCDSKF